PVVLKFSGGDASNMISPGLVLIIVALLAGAVGFVYNSLVSLSNRATAAWSDIDVQLKRRHDLVGNLVETVKGSAAHERDTLQRLVEARSQATAATDRGDPGEAG